MRISPFVVHCLKVIKSDPYANTAVLGREFFPDSPKRDYPKQQGESAADGCRMMRAGSGWTGKLERAGLIWAQWDKTHKAWRRTLTSQGTAALDNWDTKCPYCGEALGKHDQPVECPECGRDGCCNYVGGCMPGGQGCLCPECECLAD